MRVVRVARPAHVPPWRRSGVTAAAFGVVGVAAAILVLVAPSGSERSGLGLVAAVAGLAIGIALALAWRAVTGRAPAPADDDLERLLGPLFDDAYVLIASPRLPGRSADLAALLVGPPGVRALVARAWDGHYRVSGKRWEYDTHSRRGWILCRTNPTWDAASVRETVVRWARDEGLEANLPIEAAIAFPRRESQIVLEEPTVEVVTRDNAPWWAARIARAQRLDATRIERFVEAVVAASRAVPAPVRPSKAAATRG